MSELAKRRKKPYSQYMCSSSSLACSRVFSYKRTPGNSSRDVELRSFREIIEIRKLRFVSRKEASASVLTKGESVGRIETRSKGIESSESVASD